MLRLVIVSWGPDQLEQLEQSDRVLLSDNEIPHLLAKLIEVEVYPLTTSSDLLLENNERVYCFLKVVKRSLSELLHDDSSCLWCCLQV